jgi:cytochrome c oxidase cbb3-type subunit 3
MRRLIVLLVLTCGCLLGQGGPYERQKVDSEAARRGRAVWAQFCINCHGNLAKGTDNGPDLIRSPLVLRDRLGNELGPSLKTLPGHNVGLTAAQVTDITHFLKELIEANAKNRNPTMSPNVLTGDANAGKAFFNGVGGCAKCHSVTGDLAGIGRRFEDPIDLQQRFLFPRRTKPIMVKVTPPSGPTVTGTLIRVDDFNISIKDAQGQYRDWKRVPQLHVEMDNPYAAHETLLDVYTDKDIHNVVRYLESQK